MDNIGMRCIVGWRKSKDARDENKTHIETSITTRPNTTEYLRSVLVVTSVPCSTKQSCEINFQFVVTAHSGPSHPRHARRARWAGPKCAGAKKKKERARAPDRAILCSSPTHKNATESTNPRYCRVHTVLDEKVCEAHTVRPHRRI